MPEMDGFEASSEIRKYEADCGLERVPIVAFTVNAMEGDREKCLKAGMDDYLTKPVQPDGIESVLLRWLPDNIELQTTGDDFDILGGDGSEMPINSSSVDFSIVEGLKNIVGEQHRSILEHYLDFARKAKPMLVEAYEENDVKGLRLAAHSFKASSMQLGATLLGELAMELETMARNNNISSAGPLVERFSYVCEEVTEAFKSYLERESTRN